MLRFHSLTLRNFMSYGNVPTTFDLSQPGSTLIAGRDLDANPDGSSSNGVGKTTMVQALVYALYDKPLASLNKDMLVNMINNKFMEVTVIFEKKGTFFKVARARKMKAGPYGNWVKLYERVGDAEFTDDDEVTLDSSGNTNDEIERKIGIPYELFVRIIVFSASHVPFLSLPTKHPTQPSQQSFIEELFDLKMLTQKAEVLREQIKANETELNILANKVEMSEKQQKHHQQQVLETKTRIDQWERDRKQKIKDLQSKLKRVEGVDLDQQQLLHQEIETQRGISSKKSQTLKTLLRDRKDAVSAIAALEGEIQQLADAVCPYCKQEFHDAEEKITHVTSDLSALREALELLNSSISEVEGAIEEADKQIAAISGNLLFDDVEELLSIKFKKDEFQANIDRLSEEPNPYVSVLEMIEKNKPELIERTSMNDLVDTLEHQRFLMKLLTKNDSFIRKAMVNKNLPFLNSRLNYYLRRMELPHIAEFTHDLTPKISRFDSEFDFNCLSAGQKARVNFALSLSFRDVLQNLHDKVNLFCVDEVLDIALDSTGVTLAAKLLKEEARKSGTCMFIISHREEISSSFDKKMYVTMENQFSRAYQSEEDVKGIEERIASVG